MDKLNKDQDLVIDWQVVAQLFQAGANACEVAARFDIHVDDLSDACERQCHMQISDYKKRLFDSGNALLKAKQFQMCMEGNAPMLQHAAKVRLKQTDKPTIIIKGFSKMNYKEKTEAVMNLVEKDKVSAQELVQLMNMLKIAFELENGQISLEKLEELEKKYAV